MMSRSADHNPAPTAADAFDDGVSGAAAPGSTADSGLHVCPACASPLVAPVAWEQAGPHEWAVTLQCPNCEWWDADLFDEATIERFDEELDRGTEALVRDLLRLTRANMEDDVERFAAALHAGAILPEDF